MNKLYRFLCGILLFLLVMLTANAQHANYTKKILNKRKEPSLLTFSKKAAYKSSQYKKVLEKELRLSSKDSYKQLSVQQDNIGFSHRRLQQYFEDVAVEGGIYLVHSKGEEIASMNGDFYRIPLDFKVQPQIAEKTALEVALKAVSAEQYVWEMEQEAFRQTPQKPKGQLLILPVEKGGQSIFYLAYRYEISTIKPFDQRRIYIDAKTGDILENYSAMAFCSHKTLRETNIHLEMEEENCIEEKKANERSFVPGNADTRYSGRQTIETEFFEGQYRLHDYTRASGGIITKNFNGGFPNPPLDFFDNDNNWTVVEYGNTSIERAALDAHWGAEMTYDYFKQVHGRDSWNDNGSAINLTVGAEGNTSASTLGNIEFNAFFGNLDGKSAASIDIVAHEIGHGVTASSSGLITYKESGALQEGLSDIWGACVSNYVNLGKNIWLHGHEFSIGSHRNMANPKATDEPDTYQGEFWIDVNSPFDNGGTHQNGVVLGHWFYLLSEGSSQTDEINDNGDTFHVDGIGIEKAAKIVYRLETVYLTQKSSYYGARGFGIQAAEDLFGVGSKEAIATKNAFHAVGLGDENNPICNVVNISTPSQSIVLKNLNAPIEILRIYAANYNLVFECIANCETDQIINSLNSGVYHIDLQMMTENYEVICTINQTVEVGNKDLLCMDLGGDSDGDGICNDEDCTPNNPVFPGIPGNICDDKNPLTINDSITTDGCNCVGTLVGGATADCEKLQIYSPELGRIFISSDINLQSVTIIIDEELLSLCNGNCGNSVIIDGLNIGDYLVTIQLVGLDGSQCIREEVVRIEDNVNTGGNKSCENLLFTGGTRQIAITGLTSQSKLEILGEKTNWQGNVVCEGNCSETQLIENLEAGDYFVKVNLLSNGNYCYREEKVTVTTGSNGGNCNTLIFNGMDGQITVSGLSLQSKVEILGKNTNWQIVSVCDNNCSETQTIPNLQSGDYAVKVNMSSSDGSYCYREEKVTVSNGDNSSGAVDCNNLVFAADNGQITISGLTANYGKLELIGNNTGWQLQTICEANCNDPQIIPNLAAGDYTVKVYQGNTDNFCYREERVAVPNSSQNRNDEILTQNDLLLFPNPARNQVTLQTTRLKGKTGVIQIYDTFGRIIQSFPNIQFAEYQIFNLSDFKNGIYWLSVQVEGKSAVGKRLVVETLK